MRRLLAFAFLLGLSSTTFAQPYLETRVEPRRARVDPDTTVEFLTYVVVAGAESAIDLHLHYELSGDATLTSIDSGTWTCSVASKNADCMKSELAPYSPDVLRVITHTDAKNGGAAQLVMSLTSASPPNPNSEDHASGELQ